MRVIRKLETLEDDYYSDSCGRVTVTLFATHYACGCMKRSKYRNEARGYSGHYAYDTWPVCEEHSELREAGE